MKRLDDRRAAGKELARGLLDYSYREDVLVLALPRGGVPVAWEVAQALRAPLEPWIVRKLGAPDNTEFAIGALAAGGHRFVDEQLLARLGIGAAQLTQIVAREGAELERRERLYRGGRPAMGYVDKTIILVDDGIATGASLRVSIDALRAAGAREVIVAAPVGPASTCRMLETLADRVVCLHRPEPFHSVGLWYEDFAQTSDAEVQALLANQPWLGVPEHAR